MSPLGIDTCAAIITTKRTPVFSMLIYPAVRFLRLVRAKVCSPNLPEIILLSQCQLFPSGEVSFLQKCRVARPRNLLKKAAANLAASLAVPCFLIVTRNLFAKKGVFLSPVFVHVCTRHQRRSMRSKKVDTTFKL